MQVRSALGGCQLIDRSIDLNNILPHCDMVSCLLFVSALSYTLLQSLTSPPPSPHPTVYVKNYQTAIRLVMELERKNSGFAQFLKVRSRTFVFQQEISHTSL